jgi:hypothetical protein
VVDFRTLYPFNYYFNFFFWFGDSGLINSKFLFKHTKSSLFPIGRTYRNYYWIFFTVKLRSEKFLSFNIELIEGS